MIKNSILALLIGSAFFACVGDIGTNLKSEQAQRLLSGDTVKHWVRVERFESGDEVDVSTCEQSVSFTFTNFAEEADTLYYFYQFPTEQCDEGVIKRIRSKAVYELESDIDNNFKGKVKLSEFIPEENTISELTIIDLTTRYMKLEYREGDTDIVEIFDGSAEYQNITLE
ncbi:hypothetical protein [Reichenbachiella versicolor]|uniref:hypothetical protein n=1 Tax=Reichenbachiella versicolor TaxID=1821036 RepID=UPI0013A57C0B|nr:hypothetical protein [Reichenbachiella versicolor]